MFDRPTPPTLEPLLLTARQAAKVLAVSERTLATYTKSGLLPVVRIGHSVRYSPEALREWINNAMQKKCGEGQNVLARSSSIR